MFGLHGWLVNGLFMNLFLELCFGEVGLFFLYIAFMGGQCMAFLWAAVWKHDFAGPASFAFQTDLNFFVAISFRVG